MNVCVKRVRWYQMAAIYNVLERHRLENYYKGFLDIGVADERDFIDSVTDEDLDKMGKTRRLNPNVKHCGQVNNQAVPKLGVHGKRIETAKRDLRVSNFQIINNLPKSTNFTPIISQHLKVIVPYMFIIRTISEIFCKNTLLHKL